MTFSSLLRTLRDRWLFLVAGLLVGLLGALLVIVLTPRTYASTSSLYVSAFDNSQSATSAYQGSLLSQQRVKSYSELMVSERVLQTVIDRLGLPETAPELAQKVSVTSATDSTILAVTVSDRDPRRAADMANAVAGRFTEVVAELERPRVPGAAPAVNVSVVDGARPVLEAVTPKVPLNLVVGAVVGLVAAAATALVRGSLDTTIRSASELTTVTAATSLGSLPLDPILSSGNLLTTLGDVGYGEAVRRVRTNLLFADVDEPPTTLAITSSMPTEGKTTLVCALAAAFAQTSRVAVVEGDLRRPTIAARLGLEASVGLTTVLSRRAGLAEAMQRWGSYGVDVLVCGNLPPNPSELLSSRQMRDLMTRLSADYDIVLIDGPPLVPVADGAILASRADGAVLLCREGVTTHSQLTTSVEALSAVGARLFGSVLTMAQPTVRKGADGYASPYGYGAAPPGVAAPLSPERAAAPERSPARERSAAVERGAASSDHAAGSPAQRSPRSGRAYGAAAPSEVVPVQHVNGGSRPHTPMTVRGSRHANGRAVDRD